MIAEAQANIMSHMGGGGAGGPGGGLKLPSPEIKPNVGDSPGSLRKLSFSADLIAQMSPQQVQGLQTNKILPQGTALPKKMEKESPGILETISEELKDYFDFLEKQEKELEIEPEEVTPEDDAEQAADYRKQLKDEAQMADRGYFRNTIVQKPKPRRPVDRRWE
jgi:hypothetical protein